MVAGVQQRAAAGLILFTPASMQQITDPAGSATKIYTLPPGIDAELFSPVTESDDPTRDPIILFLANLNYRKGIFTLLDAFDRVGEALPSCRLSIVGSGEDEAEVARRVARMTSRDRVSMRGPAERHEVPTLMRDCTVYCLPSYGEPFGMTALEAMACGKPVVATAAGGLAHLVPAEGGRTVPPRDPAALAAALIEVLGSPALRRSMGDHNRQVVENDYTWPRIGARLESIYQSVLRRVRAL
jgi:glycosyltransferase involved in cell wall biosynthesis